MVAQLRGLPPGTAEQLPHGRPTAAAVAVLAPHLDSEAEGALLDERQAADTTGVVARPGAHDLLGSQYPIAIVTSCSLPLAHARLAAAAFPFP